MLSTAPQGGGVPLSRRGELKEIDQQIWSSTPLKLGAHSSEEQFSCSLTHLPVSVYLGHGWQ